MEAHDYGSCFILLLRICYSHQKNKDPRHMLFRKPSGKGHLIYYPKARTYINNVMQYISRNEQKHNMLARLRWKVLSKAKVGRKGV